MDLLDNGASIVKVQTLLGHESLATTRRYLKARPHELRDAVQSLASSRALAAGSEYLWGTIVAPLSRTRTRVLYHNLCRRIINVVIGPRKCDTWIR